jgi:hypothetical protein
MREITSLVILVFFISCTHNRKDKLPLDNILSMGSNISSDTVIYKKLFENTKLSVIVLPPYDEIANAGISPDVQKYIEDELKKDTNLVVVKFPLTKLMNTPYQNIFDKKYCKPLLEKVDAKILIMSKLDQVLRTGNISRDSWNLKIRIFNIESDIQVDSEVKFDSLSDAGIKKVLLMNHAKLINEIHTIANSVYNQLLYVPVLAYKVSFSTNKVGPGQLIKAVVTRY